MAQQALAFRVVHMAVGLGRLDHRAQHQPGHGVLFRGGGDLGLGVMGQGVVEQRPEAGLVLRLRILARQLSHGTTRRRAAQQTAQHAAQAATGAALRASQLVQQTAKRAAGPARAAAKRAAQHLVQAAARAAAGVVAQQVVQQSAAHALTAGALAANALAGRPAALLVVHHAADSLGQHHAGGDFGQTFHQAHAQFLSVMQDTGRVAAGLLVL